MNNPLLLCLRLLKRRPYSKYELDTAMARRGVSDDEREETLTRLEKQGLVDDQAFAEAWVRTRDLLRPRGASLLRLELVKKGIDKEIIHRVLESRRSASDEGGKGEEDLARELVAARERSYQNLPPEVRERRIMALLSRRGFSYDVIRRIMNS